MQAELRYVRTIAIVAGAIAVSIGTIALTAANHAPLAARVGGAGILIAVVVGAFALVRRLATARRPIAETPRARLAPYILNAALVVFELAILACYLPAITSGHVSKDDWQMIAILGGNLVLSARFLVRGDRPEAAAVTARRTERVRAILDARNLPPGPARDRARAAVRRDFAYKVGICALGIALTIALGPRLGWIVAMMASFGPLALAANLAERRLAT